MSSIEEENYDVMKITMEMIGSVLESSGISTEKVSFKKISREQNSSTNTYMIEAGGERHVLKIFSNDELLISSRLFSSLAEEGGISVPVLLNSSDECSDLAASHWILWEWSVGQPINEIKDSDKKTAAAVEAGRVLRKMHDIDVSGAKESNPTVEFYRKKIDNLPTNDVFSDEERKKIVKLTLESDEISSLQGSKLIHGDIAGDNIIFDEATGKATFIDPGEITAGDPMMDLAGSQRPRLSREFREGIMAGYTAEKPLSREEESRFLRWLLLKNFIFVCRPGARDNKEVEKTVADVRSLIEQIENL